LAVRGGELVESIFGSKVDITKEFEKAEKLEKVR
jgi:hypothetical protein